MRKQVRIVVAGLIIAVAGLITWQVLHDREPVYEGKRLSKWLAKDDGSPKAEENARQAVLHAGTNAIPTLL